MCHMQGFQHANHVYVSCSGSQYNYHENDRRCNKGVMWSQLTLGHCLQRWPNNKPSLHNAPCLQGYYFISYMAHWYAYDVWTYSKVRYCSAVKHFFSYYYQTDGPEFSYKLRYIVGFGLVVIAISTNPKPTTYCSLHVRWYGPQIRRSILIWRNFFTLVLIWCQ